MNEIGSVARFVSLSRAAGPKFNRRKRFYGSENEARKDHVEKTRHRRGEVVEKGKTLEMDWHKATELVSAGQAEFLDDSEGEEDGRAVEEREQYGVRVETPTHGDPGPVVLGDEPRRPKVKGGGK